MAAKKASPSVGMVAENRRARRDYAIEDEYEAGLMLQGTEVKALRAGKAMIAESYAAPKDGEIWLINAHIPEYLQANRFNHDERRPRKLLMRRREIAKLSQAVDREGMTLVPLKIFFNDRGIAKLQLGVAKGRKNYDKRQVEKERDWNRDKQRLLRRSVE